LGFERSLPTHEPIARSLPLPVSFYVALVEW
jgi:hypothetical protein